MELPFGLLAFCATMTVALAQQEPQLAPQSVQQASPSRSAPLLGVRYSASTDVSHVSFNSPLVSYGDSLNEIQLPAAPIQPANLRQAQEDNSSGESQGEQAQTLVRSGNQAQRQLQSQQVEPQTQVTQAIQPQSNTNPQQFISVQQYPARARLQPTPQGFSLTQNLPGPQPQASTRNAAQYSAPQTQQSAPPQQYSVAQQPQQYASPLGLVPQQQQTQYPAPVAYSSPSSDGYFATGPFAAQYPISNYIDRQPYPQPVPSQYRQQVPSQSGPLQYTSQVPAQSIVPQYVQQVANQYAQPEPQYASQSALPSGYSSAPAQFVSRVAFSGPVGGFSYEF